MDNSSVETGSNISKFQITIRFEIDEDFMALVPAHRNFINFLINKGIIDSYTVSLEAKKSWIIINASNKQEAQNYLSRSPLYRFWTFEIDELYVYDGQNYRLPAIQMN